MSGVVSRFPGNSMEGCVHEFLAALICPFCESQRARVRIAVREGIVEAVRIDQTLIKIVTEIPTVTHMLVTTH